MTGRTLDMRQLRHVVELDRYRNYRRAAEALCISQPALTKSIQQLEASLGTTLFDRMTSGIGPTPACRVILEHARRVFLELDEMHHQLGALADLRGGELKLGTGPIMVECVLPEPMTELMRDLPDVGVQITVEDWATLPKLARQGELDLVVMDAARLQDEPDLEVVRLGRIENVLVCSADHPLAGAGRAAPADFLDYPLALPRISERLSIWLAQRAPEGMHPQTYLAAVHRLRCHSVGLLRRLVLQTHCITGGPRALFAAELAAGTVVELKLEVCDALYIEPTVGYLKGRTLPPAAARFVEILRRHWAGTAAEMPPRVARLVK